MRSLLFVPGDDPRKLEKATTAGADALIVDLEDSVAPGRKGGARETAAAPGPAMAAVPELAAARACSSAESVVV